MKRSSLDLPPGVSPVIVDKQPKGCRVKITVDEPGFSDARILVKLPYRQGVDEPPLEVRAGESLTLILKAHLVNQIVLEGIVRDGDPPDPDLYLHDANERGNY